MTKITEKAHTATLEDSIIDSGVLHTDFVSLSAPLETEHEDPAEPSEPGITLPDDVGEAQTVAAEDRLLAFDADGNPLTATAQQLKDFAAEGLVSEEALNEALAGRMPVVKAQEGRPEPNSFGVVTGLSGNSGAPLYGAPLLSFGAPGYEAQIILGGIGAWEGAWNRIYFRNRNGDSGAVSDWKEFYHSGNFDPSEYLKFLGMSVDISESLLGMGFQYDTGGSGTTGPFISGGHPRYPLQLVCGYWGGNGGNHNLKFRTRNGDTGQWNPWYTVYSTGNLTPATAASVGLMSAEDKIKLNAVASAMSLSEDEPATMALNQEESVSSEISIRAQRSARYQMQTDELLYDALEAFARNHPEYTEFAEWIAAKDRIRAELAKPETINLD